MLNRIVIICTGNICRSPIAEGLLRARLPAQCEVSSAGVAALVGEPADPLAIAVMRDHGYDISAHRAQQMALPVLAKMDLILALDQSHVTGVLSRYPQLRGRVHKLLKWQENKDVGDPYQQPKWAFERAYEIIDGGVNDWLPRLG